MVFKNTLIMQNGLKDLLIVAQPGRRRENLMLLIQSITGVDAIQCVDFCSDATGFLNSHPQSLVLIHHNILQKEAEDELSLIRTRFPLAYIVFITSHPQPDDSIMTTGINKVLYDGFAIDSLLDIFTAFIGKNDFENK